MFNFFEETTRKVRTFKTLDRFGNLGFEPLILLWFRDIERYFQIARVYAFFPETLIGYDSQVYATILGNQGHEIQDRIQNDNF